MNIEELKSTWFLLLGFVTVFLLILFLARYLFSNEYDNSETLEEDHPLKWTPRS